MLTSCCLALQVVAPVLHARSIEAAPCACLLLCGLREGQELARQHSKGRVRLPHSNSDAGEKSVSVHGTRTRPVRSRGRAAWTFNRLHGQVAQREYERSGGSRA